jgi:hypothetical protein
MDPCTSANSTNIVTMLRPHKRTVQLETCPTYSNVEQNATKHFYEAELIIAHSRWEILGGVAIVQQVLLSSFEGLR